MPPGSDSLVSPVLTTNLLVKGAVLKVNYQYFSIRRCKIKDSRILSTGQILKVSHAGSVVTV